MISPSKISLSCLHHQGFWPTTSWVFHVQALDPIDVTEFEKQFYSVFNYICCQQDPNRQSKIHLSTDLSHIWIAELNGQ